jgi:hypothetical protein
MGATTLYHPVSLYVIRGAFAFCGVKVGKIQQIVADHEASTASYRVTITEIPQRFFGNGPKGMCEALQSCFAGDVEILSCVWSDSQRDGKQTITAILDTSLGAGGREMRVPNE